MRLYVRVHSKSAESLVYDAQRVCSSDSKKRRKNMSDVNVWQERLRVIAELDIKAEREKKERQDELSKAGS